VPDDSYRWLGSIAADKEGNILLAYSVSSKKIFPSIRYVGRQVTDPLNLMSQEGVLAHGKQSSDGDRWGDYASVSLDPTDDCTFWITGEYRKGETPQQLVTASESRSPAAVNPGGTAPAAPISRDRTAERTAESPSGEQTQSNVGDARFWDTVISAVTFPGCK